MREWVYGSEWGKRISYTLVMSILLPLLLLTLPAKRANAQVARLPQVAVLDFGVLPAVKASGILGRNATDAVVIEMTRTGRYDVSPRATINQQIADLGLTLPLDNIGLQKLGQNLGSDFVASGDIVDVKFEEKPRRARVTLSVRLTDVISGELANGAIETGISPAPAPGFQPDDEKLIADAIQNAAFLAVRTITSYNLPTATILQVRDNAEVVLNRGAQDGIEPGQDMVVFRGTDRVGRIRVAETQNTNSRATITDIGKGIRPEDKARAVFKLPGYEVTSTGEIKSSPVKDIAKYTPKKKNNKSILNVILGIAAAVIIATLVFDKKSRTNGSGLSGINAQAFSEPSNISSDGSGSRVLVTWDPSSDIPRNNVIEYQVYRDGQIIAALPPTVFRFEDSAQLNGTVVFNEIAYGGSQNIPTTTGTTATATTTTTTTTTTTGTTGTNGTNGTTGTTSTSGNTGQITPDLPTSLRQAIRQVTAMGVGVPHTYSVQILFRQVQAINPASGTGGNTATGGGQTGGGTTNSGTTGTTGTTGGNTATGSTGGQQTILYRLTPGTRTSGPATPVARPTIVGPNGDQNIGRVSIRFNTVQGANQYVVEFSTTPTFSDKKVISLRNGTAQPFYANGTGAAAFAEFDLTTDNTLNTLPGGSRIFYRVGARSQSDTPGPLKASERGVPNGDNYIYSGGEFFFTKLNTPPPAP